MKTKKLIAATSVCVLVLFFAGYLTLTYFSRNSYDVLCEHVMEGMRKEDVCRLFSGYRSSEIGSGAKDNGQDVACVLYYVDDAVFWITFDTMNRVADIRIVIGTKFRGIR
jgi:hypothetical protein